MLKSFDTVLTNIRELAAKHSTRRLVAASGAAAVFIALGAVAVGAVPGVQGAFSTTSETTSISEAPQVRAVSAKARSRVAGGRLSAPVPTLPAVTKAMSDRTFYAVVERGVWQSVLQSSRLPSCSANIFALLKQFTLKPAARARKANLLLLKSYSPVSMTSVTPARSAALFTRARIAPPVASSPGHVTVCVMSLRKKPPGRSHRTWQATSCSTCSGKK